MTDRILGWRLHERDRASLLSRFPPQYQQVVADHVTFGRKSAGLTLPDIPVAEVVGRADDGAGVEALVVALGGSTDRPTGGTYHITWSLAEGREARESNDVIAEQGWDHIGETTTVRLQPSEWP